MGFCKINHCRITPQAEGFGAYWAFMILDEMLDVVPIYKEINETAINAPAVLELIQTPEGNLVDAKTGEVLSEPEPL